MFENAEKDSMKRDERAGTKAEDALDYHPNGKSKRFGDKLTGMHVLLLNLGRESSEEVKQALSGQGYQITTTAT